MGRNKMEKEFSEKLGRREIQPRAAAWDRLDAMLSTAEAQQKPKRNYWLFVAAALVGVALFSSIFLIQNDAGQTPDGNSVQVAGSDNKQQPAGVDSVAAPKIQLADASEKSRPVETAPKHRTGKKQRQMQQQPLLASVKDRETVDTLPSEQTNRETGDDDRLPESLLAAIRTNTDTQKKAVVKVDAKSLLNGVDENPHASASGNKFLRTVGRGYQTVKVAVANRNLEENH